MLFTSINSAYERSLKPFYAQWFRYASIKVSRLLQRLCMIAVFSWFTMARNCSSTHRISPECREVSRDDCLWHRPGRFPGLLTHVHPGNRNQICLSSAWKRYTVLYTLPSLFCFIVLFSFILFLLGGNSFRSTHFAEAYPEFLVWYSRQHWGWEQRSSAEHNVFLASIWNMHGVGLHRHMIESLIVRNTAEQTKLHEPLWNQQISFLVRGHLNKESAS